MPEIRSLHEDECLLAVSKPAGIHSVQLRKGGGDSVAASLIEKFPFLSSVSPEPGDAGLVHRLDHSTSGILLVAKTREAWENLRRQFANREVLKTYLALVEGEVAKQHNIQTYLGSPYRRGKKVRVYEKMPDHGRAQEASTQFQSLNNITDRDVALIEVKMETGVRHQIRSHCAHVGYPLLGDQLYGSQRIFSEVFPEIDREFFLHAYKLKLLHPHSGNELNLVDEPYDLETAGISLRASMS